MNDNKMLLTAGQFASLHNINKRTLHYYDDIGLFSPAHKGENGYRYYTYLQSPTSSKYGYKCYSVSGV